MKIYIRKLKPHDISHEVSVRKDIVENFFGNKNEFKVIAKKTRTEGNVVINAATDPRFGGDFKQMLRNEGGESVDDLVVFYKKKDFFELELIKTTDQKYEYINQLCQSNERHTIIDIESFVQGEINYSERTLGAILREYYEDTNHSKNTGIMLFGITYGDYIEDNNKNKNEIVKESGIGETYLTELNKALSLRKFIQPRKHSENVLIDLKQEPKEGGFNKIFYGVPGSGKSYTANQIAFKYTSDEFIIRTTFYPDYTNSDFVGQIIPKISEEDENSVIYDIQGGPFSDALVKAIDNPDKYVCLIVEEINRGNSAAIFGDIFQLLDRKLDGESEYVIKNYIITQYLQGKSVNGKYDFRNVRIPSNLILLGTMNTSDQNVFTLDTAFKRRWTMEYIPNEVEQSLYKDNIIPGLNISWLNFVKVINRLIIEYAYNLGINGEDKQIGSYFLSGLEWENINSFIGEGKEEEAKRLFAEKVLAYLWDDVAKLDKSAIFDNEYKTFEDVVNNFIKGNKVLKINLETE